MDNITEIGKLFTEGEKYRVSKVFQNYYCMGLYEIAEEDECCKTLFEKLGLIDQ